jgi:hypothetical protein
MVTAEADTDDPAEADTDGAAEADTGDPADANVLNVGCIIMYTTYKHNL